MDDLTEELLQSAEALAVRIEARALLAVLERPGDLDAIPADARLPVYVAARDPEILEAARPPESEDEDETPEPRFHVISIPDVALSRMDRVKLSVASGLSQGILRKDGAIVCAAGSVEGGLDAILAIDPAAEHEMLAADEMSRLVQGVDPAVFHSVLDLALELASAGREGKPVGALFVVGNHQRVMELSQPLVFNPFHGYPEDERKVLSPDLRETLREFSTIDGAFVISGSGVVVAAGRHLQAAAPTSDATPGLGARHAAAAGITSATRATAIAISESTGVVRIYRDGNVILELAGRTG